MKDNKVRLAPYKRGTLVRSYVGAQAGEYDSPIEGLCIVTGGTRKEKRWADAIDAHGGWDIWQTVYSFHHKAHFNFQVENIVPVDGSGQRWEIVGEGGESESPFDSTRLTLIEKE